MDDRAASGKTSVTVIGGTGSLGFGLALRLAQAGVRVTIGSRSAERAGQAVDRALAALADGDFHGASNEEAARDADFVVISVPFASHAENLKQIAPTLQAGQIVIDATVPLAAEVGGRPTRLLGVWQGSAAEQARELLPAEVAVVSALHTVSASALGDLSAPLDQDTLLCGDSREVKRRAAALLTQIEGLRCVDCGRLEMSRITESLTPLIISVNIRYKAHAGVRLTGVPDEIPGKSDAAPREARVQ